MTVTLSRTWEVTPNEGSFIEVEYRVGDAYPIVHDFTMLMPAGFDLDEPDRSFFPAAVVPLLSGFDINWRTSSGARAEHELSQLRVDLQTNGWYTAADGVGPVLRAIVGMRDNSGGDPPDDPFVAWLHVSALVVFDYEIAAVVSGRPPGAFAR